MPRIIPEPSANGGGSGSWKDPVAAVGDLPATGNTLGDAILVTGESTVYTWDGAAWTATSAATDLSDLQNGLYHWYEYEAIELAVVGASWPVTVNAGSATDTNDSEVTVLLFDDTTEEGAGIRRLKVPNGATVMDFETLWRSETTPVAAATIAGYLYGMTFPDNGVPGAWSAAYALDSQAIGTNENEHYTLTEDIPIASVNAVANEYWMGEFTRNTGVAGNLTSDVALLSLRFRFR